MTRIRTLIVDDEDPARELLRSFLAAWPAIEIIGEAADGATALSLIRRDRPDLMFLDVQMPEMTGFDVVTKLASDETPIIVFVTAYDRYALKAFEISALDYLLKPFDAARLSTTMTRILARRDRAEYEAALGSLLSQLRPSADERIVVKVDGRHVFLDAADVSWIEAADKEVRVHVGGATVCVREAMNGIEQRLDASRFVRVHRSAIVNRAHVREIQPWFKGDYVIILRDGTRVVTGPSYRAAVQQLIGR
ncbi:MAG: LytR/AlgR family response regulator transcription factor [Deltaproteobacteria bacterium]